MSHRSPTTTACPPSPVVASSIFTVLLLLVPLVPVVVFVLVLLLIRSAAPACVCPPPRPRPRSCLPGLPCPFSLAGRGRGVQRDAVDPPSSKGQAWCGVWAGGGAAGCSSPKPNNKRRTPRNEHPETNTPAPGDDHSGAAIWGAVAVDLRRSTPRDQQPQINTDRSTPWPAEINRAPSSGPISRPGARRLRCCRCRCRWCGCGAACCWRRGAWPRGSPAAGAG